jgi:hypothetical protein
VLNKSGTTLKASPTTTCSSFYVCDNDSKDATRASITLFGSIFDILKKHIFNVGIFNGFLILLLNIS